MEPGRPKQPTGVGVLPGIPALETVVRAHSEQLIKLNTELSSAFAQVTAELREIRDSATSTSSSLTSLANQVTALTNLATQNQTGGETEPALQDVFPPAATPPAPPDLGLDPGGSLPSRAPAPTRGFLTCVGGIWDNASYCSTTNPLASARRVPVWL